MPKIPNLYEENMDTRLYILLPFLERPQAKYDNAVSLTL